MCDVYLESYKLYANRDCLGSKAKDSHQYVYKSYKEVIDTSI